MIPLSDDPPRRSAPVVMVGLVLLNILMFLYELTLPGSSADQFIQAFGVVPCEITAKCPVPAPAPGGSIYLTLLTSMFLHGGWLHLGSNMLYLWVFGDNVEDSFGHLRFLFFYLICGVIAGLAQVLISPDSTIPSIGASGAIAGVLGSYMLLFGRAHVRTLVFLGPIILLPRIPAIVLIGFWFLTQLLSGVGQLGVEHETGGVAFWAHIGGFLAGMALTLIVRPQVATAPGRTGR